MRSDPLSNPPPLPEATAGGHRTWEIALRAVTPIYRGGARQDAIDTRRPFRVPAIRGLLRSWWRATSPIRDTATLREREGALFGTVFRDRAVASRVRVGVVDASSTAVGKPRDADYALWVQRDGREHVFHQDARGTLRVSVDDPHADGIRRALSAWLLLGGIGGRTRRGLGAVDAHDPDVRPNLSTVPDLVGLLRTLAPPRLDRPWPSLGGAELLVGPPQRRPMDAWLRGLHTMQAVRMDTSHGQKRPVNLNFTPHRWHDDDYVVFTRDQTFRSPRAALGLPLQFQSWGGRGQRRTMMPEGHNRFPSPVHLRPIRIGDGWRPVMTLLRVPFPQEIQVDRTRGTLDPAGIDRFATDVACVDGWERLSLAGVP